MKKLLSVMLILALLFSMAPVSMAQTAGDFSASYNGIDYNNGSSQDYYEGSDVYFKFETSNTTEYTMTTSSEILFKLPHEGGKGFADVDETSFSINGVDSDSGRYEIHTMTTGGFLEVKVWNFSSSAVSAINDVNTSSGRFELTCKAPLLETDATKKYKMNAEWTNPNKTLNLWIFPKEADVGNVYFEKCWMGNDAPQDSVEILWTEYESTNPGEIVTIEGSEWTIGPIPQMANDYTVAEQDVPSEWVTTYAFSTDGFSYSPVEDYVTVTKDGELYIKITNTYEEPPVTPGSVTVYKTFEGYTGTMPLEDLIFNIDFTLYDSDDAIVDVLYPIITGGAWNGTFEGVTPGAGYYVVEEPFAWEGDGTWTWMASPTSFDVAAGSDTRVDIVNTYNTCSVDIEKTVSPSSIVEGGGTVEYEIAFENTSVGQTFDYVRLEEGPEGWFTTGNVSNLKVDFIEDMTTTHALTYAWEDLFDDYLYFTTFGGFEPGDVMRISFDYDITGLEDGSYTNLVTGTAMKEPIVYSEARVPYPNGDCMMAYAVDSAELTIDPYNPPAETGDIIVHKDRVMPYVNGIDDDVASRDSVQTTIPMADVEFRLREGTSMGAVTATAMTNTSGEAIFGDIPYGTYWVEEVVPEGYITPFEGQQVDINSDYEEVTLDVENWFVNYEFTKEVDPTSTTSERPTYTLTLENTGDFTIWIPDDGVVDSLYGVINHLSTEVAVTVYLGPSSGTFPGDYTEITSTSGFEGYLNPGYRLMMVFDYPDAINRTSSTQSINNTATATAWFFGFDEIMLDPQTDSASFTIPGDNPPRDDDDPGVRIEKSVDVDEASVGDTVTYTIKVTNNGDVSLTDVMVVDGAIGVTWDIGGLGKDDSITEEFEYEIQECDFENGV
ncbi:MAG: hypothetical protein C0604_10190, partial [Clostridiales bacterium]